MKKQITILLVAAGVLITTGRGISQIDSLLVTGNRMRITSKIFVVNRNISEKEATETIVGEFESATNRFAFNA